MMSLFCSSGGGQELSHDAEEQLPGDAEEEDEGAGKPQNSMQLLLVVVGIF